MSKSYSVTARGVVISRRAAAEGSVRVHLYTEAFGLLTAFAKSAREERSKLRPHLQVGCFGSYTLVRSPHDSRITGAFQIRNSYFELAGKPHAQAASARLCALMRQLVQGEDENQELFGALWHALAAFPGLEAKDVRVAEHLAVARILSSLGYVPAQTSIPHLAGAHYTDTILAAVAPHERELTRTINKALAASHLE